MFRQEERRVGQHPGKMPGGIKLLECINELEAVFGRMTLTDRDRATTAFKGMTTLVAGMPFYDPAARDPYVENMYLQDAARQTIDQALTSGHMPVWTDYDGVFVELDHEKLFGSNKWNRTHSLRTGVYLALNASHGADGAVRQECDGATLWVRREDWPRIRTDLITKRERMFGSTLAHDWSQLLGDITEEPIKAGPQWSLYEAVAWIGSGDEALVAEQRANYMAVTDPATAGALVWLRLDKSLRDRADMDANGQALLTADQARERLRLACERGNVAATAIPNDMGPRRDVPASDFISAELWPGRGGSLHRIIGGRGEAARWFEMRFSKSDALNLTAGVVTAARSAEAPPLASDRTGAAGRPTSMPIVFAELERRAASGEMMDRIAAESRALEAWFEGLPEYSAMARPKAKAIENAIRGRFRDLRKPP